MHCDKCPRPALIRQGKTVLCALCYARAQRRIYVSIKRDLKSSQKIKDVQTKITTLDLLIRDLMMIYQGTAQGVNDDKRRIYQARD